MGERDDTDEIFCTALELGSAGERAAYLDRACAGDAELRRRVERLLAADRRAGGFMRDRDADDAEPAAPGTRIGPYRLVRALGEGGMGTVYLAEQTEPVSRQVALKIIKRGMDTAEVIGRFEAERQALALMDHPSIARVFDAGETDSRLPYFVMELVDGDPITEYCARHDLRTRERIELFIEVCRAVQHAHQKGVIHRDLKPVNVLVARYDGRAVPKVIDFGIAKATSQALTGQTMFTRLGQVVGTPEYMSPEQAEMTQLDVDTRSDIYSLGVMLYELLTGTTPHDRQGLRSAPFGEMLRIVRDEEPPTPSTRVANLAKADGGNPALERLARRLRGELDWIVMRALEKDRNRRYDNANGLAADLERYLNDETVLACPPSTAYRLRKFVRRYRGPVIAAVALLVALLLGLVGTSVGIVRAQAAERAERRLNLTMALDRGLGLCDEGKVGPGMLWLVRALELCPAEEPALDRVIRANLNAWRQQLDELEAMFTHDAPVISVAFSPDGTLIATGSNDDTLQLWNVQTGRPVGAPLAHNGDVHEIAFSKDGTRLLSSDYRLTAFLWDVATGECIHTIRHGDHPHSLDASCGDACRHCGGVLGSAFRGLDDAQFLTSCGDGSVTIWDSATGERIGALPDHDNLVHDVGVSGDGRRILTACHDWHARVWDFDTRELIAMFRHDTRVTTADFCGEDGSLVVTGDADGNVYLWSVDRARQEPDRLLEESAGEFIAGPWRHHGVVHRLRASPDGVRILTASYDNTARLWYPDRGPQPGIPFEHEAAVQAVAFHPDGVRIAIACDDDTARLIRPAAGQAVDVVEYGSVDHEAAYTADGRYALVQRDPATAVVRDLTTGVAVCELAHAGVTRSLAVSPDRTRVLTGAIDGTGRLWDAATGALVAEAFRRAAGIWSVAFSPDGELMAAGSYDHVAEVRRVATGDLLGAPIDAGARALGVAFSPDGNRFALACADKITRVFALPALTLAGELVGHESSVATVTFSADGELVATGSHDNTVRVWDTATREARSAPMPHRGPIWYSVDVAFSPDGRTVASGCDDLTARVWDVATSRQVGPALRHGAGVRMVAFTEDGQVRTGTTTGAVRTWNVRLTPLRGDAEHIALWVQVRTGFELAADGMLHAIDGPDWRARSARLAAMGGPPE